MKEIIPLKKDIIFKTMIGQITNIELNHDYKVNDDLVDGNVIVSGSYKMTEASVLEEDFEYKIPFKVALSKRVKIDTIKIEIDDFRYEFNKDVMSVFIDLEFTCDEDVIEEDNKEECSFMEEEKKEEYDLMEEYFNNEVNNNIDVQENITNITNNITSNKFYTYKIYIVRSGDTLESICNKYNVSIEDIKEYNDISNINIGDKILIPQKNE